MDVLMPQLGETVAEGKITKWFKSAGDAVKPGDNLFEIETDKVSMEVPSTVAGTLSDIRFQVGEVAKVGAVVAVIAGEGDARTRRALAETPSPRWGAGVAATAPQPLPRTPVPLDPFFEVRTPARNYGPAKIAGGVAVTPLARRLASDAGIDLSRIAGSGPHGRIVARDVESAPRPDAARAIVAEAPTADQVKSLYAPGSYEEVPVDSMRRTIAARLTQAVQTVPHFYLTADVAIDRLLALREEANAASPSSEADGAAFKLSVNDFVIRALALALQHVPGANAVWAGDRILRFRSSDIGVAVALDGGLITPVIHNAETKSLRAMSSEMKGLAARAREKKLKPADYQGGASAISNLGMYSVREFSAIINPPHATILAVGAARRQAVEKEDGGVVFASMLTLTLSCDHRVVDGALGAQLLAAVKDFLERPVTMLV
jgi:pyruvate dehydrogenase E2 component (dihydrolipoamide acetyltransferase)